MIGTSLSLIKLAGRGPLASGSREGVTLIRHFSTRGTLIFGAGIHSATISSPFRKMREMA